MTPPTTHREIERKFRVHGLFELPDLSAEGCARRAHVGAPFEMSAVYHDTDELTLFRWGITLRRREGGKDEGWHMKLPVPGSDGSARDELHLDLSAGPVGSVPGALVEVVSPLLHELPLAPVLNLSTVRTPIVLQDADGHDLVEVVDDLVTIRHDGRVVSVFREIEVELLTTTPAAVEVLECVSRMLLRQGAESSSVSKAASALGPRTSEPPDVPPFPYPGPDGLAVDAIRAVLTQHVRHLLLADVAVRRDLPDSVHQMRVAARRLRSSLTTFAPLLDADACTEMREDLRWLARELGAIRDTEVMKDRLDQHCDALDPDDAGHCREVIDPQLDTRMAAARSSALAALRSDRHQQLVDDLMDAAVAPPVTTAAFQPCSTALPPLLQRTWRRLARSISALDLEGPSTPWHEARIKAKRARYAAEALEEVFGRPMRKLADALAEVTEVLGDHQDAHVAQTLLRELASQSGVSGTTGLSLGLLHAYETTVEMQDRQRFQQIWPEVRRRARAAGVN